MGESSSCRRLNLNLPPGFRFYPTDEELVVHFLHRKAALLPCHPDVIPDLHLYPNYDPWDLDGKAMCEGRKWYFYSRRTPNNSNRSTESGYWQSIGVEEPIYSSAGLKVGSKKYSAFYNSQGLRTNWIMHEYRVSSSSSSSSSSRKKNSKINVQDHSKWVLCRVYEEEEEDGGGTELSCLDEVFLSLDDLDDITFPI